MEEDISVRNLVISSAGGIVIELEGDGGETTSRSSPSLSSSAVELSVSISLAKIPTRSSTIASGEAAGASPAYSSVLPASAVSD